MRASTRQAPGPVRRLPEHLSFRDQSTYQVCDSRSGGNRGIMLILGIICLLLGLFLHIQVLWIIGIILAVVGVVLLVLPAERVGGRRWY